MSGDRATPKAGARRPTLLLVGLALTGFLSIFDKVITLTSIPFLRNPAALAAAATLGLYVWYRREGVPIHHGAQRWMIAFLLYTALLEFSRGIWTGEPEFFRYMQWAQVLVLAIVAVDLARDRRAFALVWGGIVLAILFMAISSVLALPGFTQWNSGRIGYIGVNLNTQAYWFAMASATGVWWLLTRWPRFGLQGVLTLAATGIVTSALVLAASRSALASLVLGLGIILTLSFRARNLSAYATIVPLLLLALGWVVADGAVVRDRLAATLAGEDFGARDSITVHAWEMLANAPLFGYGPVFLELLGEARGMARAISTHNSVMQVALTFGLPAVLLWGGLMASALLRAWRSYLSRRDPVGALLVALFTMSFAYGMAADLGFNKFFWMLVALSAQAPLTAEVVEPVPRPHAPTAIVRSAPTHAGPHRHMADADG